MLEATAIEIFAVPDFGWGELAGRWPWWVYRYGSEWPLSA